MSETNGTNGLPHKDWTPEQKKAIYAEMQKLFTVEDLLGYINDDEEKIPIDQVMAEAEEMHGTNDDGFQHPPRGRPMSEPTRKLPDWTPEQMKAICADMKQQFPVERLIEYIEDDDEKFPAQCVLAEIEQMVQVANRQPGPDAVVETNAPRPDCSVELTGLARAQLRVITRHAIYRCSGQTVPVAFRVVLTHLLSRVREFGEQMYRLQPTRMDVFNGVVRPLYVEFGVHDDTQIVVIRYIAPLSEPPSTYA